MKKRRIKIYCDGSSNSFESGICVCLKKSNGDDIIHFKELDKKVSGFKAEFMAMICALKFAEENCEIISDCRNLVTQLNSDKSTSCPSLHKKAMKLINDKNVEIKWVRRDKNLAGIFLEKRLKKMRKESGLDRKFEYRPGRRRRK